MMKKGKAYEVMGEKPEQQPVIGLQEKRTSRWKNYEIYLDPSPWDKRDSRLFQLQTFLPTLDRKLIPRVEFDTAKSAPALREHSILETRGGVVRRKFKGSLSVKLERDLKTKRAWLSIKYKTLDPMLIKAFQVRPNKKFEHTTRKDQTFYQNRTVYSKTIKVSCKFTKAFKTWKVVDNLCPGAVAFLGVKPESEVVLRHRRFVWNARNSNSLPSMGKRLFFKLSLLYATREDANMGHSAFHARLQLRLKEPTERDAVFVDQLRSLYTLFYQGMVPSNWNYTGVVRKSPQKFKTPRSTREYQIYFNPHAWQKRAETVGRFDAFLEGLQEVEGGLTGCDMSQTGSRVLEHFGLDTPSHTLKARTMDEVVVKMERNVDARTALITCKYKGFDPSVVSAFPVEVRDGERWSSKMEQDFHPQFARMAISLAVEVPFDVRLTAWRDIEHYFPGILKFTMLEPDWPIIVRLYKVKWEQTKQLLTIGSYGSIGKISLEYPSIKDARNGTNLFHGQWSFRVKQPARMEEDEWVQLLNSAYRLYFDHLVPSPWTYEGTHSKPAIDRSGIPPLARTDLPRVTTAGICVLQRARKDTEKPWRVLVLHRTGKRHRNDFPKGKMDEGETSALQAALREMEEETGITKESVDVVPGVRFEATRYPSPKSSDGQVLHKTHVLFLGITNCDLVLEKLELTEHKSYSWMAWDGKSPLKLHRKLLDACLAAVAKRLSSDDSIVTGAKKEEEQAPQEGHAKAEDASAASQKPTANASARPGAGDVVEGEKSNF